MVMKRLKPSEGPKMISRTEVAVEDSQKGQAERNSTVISGIKRADEERRALPRNAMSLLRYLIEKSALTTLFRTAAGERF